MKFRFSLESVLKLRRGKRDRSRRDYAQWLQQISQVEQQKQSNLGEQADVEQALRELTQSGSLQMDSISRGQVHLAQLRHAWNQLNQLQRQLQQSALEAQRILVEDDQQVKVMEKLKESHLQEFQHEQMHQEMRDEEERVQLEFFRRRSE